MIQPSAFKTIKRLVDLDRNPKLEFSIVSKQESQSKNIELFITDPYEGFHFVQEDKTHMYYRY